MLFVPYLLFQPNKPAVLLRATASDTSTLKEIETILASVESIIIAPSILNNEDVPYLEIESMSSAVLFFLLALFLSYPRTMMMRMLLGSLLLSPFPG